MTTAWTLPIAGNSADLLPPTIQNLRYASFGSPRTRFNGEYNPPQTQQLAAHRLYKVLSTPAGAYTSAMIFFEQLRELECVRFEVTPAVLMALYNGRLGNHKQLHRGSTNANFASDFGTSAVLPASAPRCENYEELLSAISGLMVLGDVLFFEHVRHLVSRLKRFVSANMERDSNRPEHVTLTLLFVNNYLGRAMAHLAVDSPNRWHNFSEAVRAVDYHGPEWQSALNGFALRLAARTFAPGVSCPFMRGSTPSRRRAPAGRIHVMSDFVRRQIPRDAQGREPCLRYKDGGMCYGGSAEKCAHSDRTHTWDRRLPRDLQDFSNRHYGPVSSETMGDRRPAMNLGSSTDPKPTAAHVTSDREEAEVTWVHRYFGHQVGVQNIFLWEHLC
ncbi:hypothetical protein PHMEG_00012650 [Phytophthora megakarya]|uniref:Uncharacterized protein n=1 Tax=Phytophthora megakarya TaxID=4795 RepID=A0A225WAA9_9STRA|nr:hypothetical protein PHMEG_00012650 [Phytophthora megakarya]